MKSQFNIDYYYDLFFPPVPYLLLGDYTLLHDTVAGWLDEEGELLATGALPSELE